MYYLLFENQLTSLAILLGFVRLCQKTWRNINGNDTARGVKDAAVKHGAGWLLGKITRK